MFIWKKLSTDCVQAETLHLLDKDFCLFYQMLYKTSGTTAVFRSCPGSFEYGRSPFALSVSLYYDIAK